MRERAPRLDFNLHPQQIPSPLSNSHDRARLNASVFSSTIHLICYFQRLVDIICRDDTTNSYICRLEYNLNKSEDFYTMYKKAILSGFCLAFTCLRIQEDVDSHWLHFLPQPLRREECTDGWEPHCHNTPCHIWWPPLPLLTIEDPHLILLTGK